MKPPLMFWPVDAGDLHEEVNAFTFARHAAKCDRGDQCPWELRRKNPEKNEELTSSWRAVIRNTLSSAANDRRHCLIEKLPAIAAWFVS
mmetsp:Transcript_20920/g.45622  ORF Transcript_20920/g.45622 Transcript_20920/m.45622 type:complete len:89 (-) Transcript_20920:166-432(-)